MRVDHLDSGHLSEFRQGGVVFNVEVVRLADVSSVLAQPAMPALLGSVTVGAPLPFVSVHRVENGT